MKNHEHSIKSKNKHLVVAEHDEKINNSYYIKKTVYFRVRTFSGKNDETFKELHASEILRENLNQEQRRILPKILGGYKFNQHLTKNDVEKIEKKCVSDGDVYKSYELTQEAMRRNWNKTNFNGKVNSEKNIPEILKEYRQKAEEIMNQENIKFKFKVEQLYYLFLELWENVLANLELVYNELFNEVKILIDDLKSLLDDLINSKALKLERVSLKETLRLVKLIGRIVWEFRRKSEDLRFRAKHGDVKSASIFIEKKYNPTLTKMLKKRFGDDENIVLIPIISAAKHFSNKDFNENSKSFHINVLPLALANTIALETGWELDCAVNPNSIIKINHQEKSKKESKEKVERLGKPSVFDGIPLSGKKYIIVDDNVTSGGSIRDLQEFIEMNNGEVVGAVTLEKGRRLTFNPRIKPNTKVLKKVSSKYFDCKFILNKVLGFQGGISSLTKQEISDLKWFFRFSSFKKIQDFESLILSALSGNYYVRDEYIKVNREVVIPKLLEEFGINQPIAETIS